MCCCVHVINITELSATAVKKGGIYGTAVRTVNMIVIRSVLGLGLVLVYGGRRKEKRWRERRWRGRGGRNEEVYGCDEEERGITLNGGLGVMEKKREKREKREKKKREERREKREKREKSPEVSSFLFGYSLTSLDFLIAIDVN